MNSRWKILHPFLETAIILGLVASLVSTGTNADKSHTRAVELINGKKSKNLIDAVFWLQEDRLPESIHE